MPEDADINVPGYNGPDRRSGVVLAEVLSEMRENRDRLDAVAVSLRAEKQLRWLTAIGVLAIVVPLGGLQWWAIHQHDQTRKSESNENIACILDQLFEHREANDDAHRRAAEFVGQDYVEPTPPMVPDQLRGSCDVLLKKLSENGETE